MGFFNRSITRRSSPHTSCAGQFVSRGFVVLLRKSNPQNHNLQTAAVRGVIVLFSRAFLSQLKNMKRAKATVSIASPAVRLTLWSVSRSSRPFHWRAKFSAVLVKRAGRFKIIVLGRSSIKSGIKAVFVRFSNLHQAYVVEKPRWQ